ncbi:MAG: polymer-forming cytoskeletal protein [Bacteroidota bacterium]
MFTSKEEHKVAEELRDTSNTIGKGTVIEGSIETFGNIRIEGRVIGDVKTKSKLVLGPSSKVHGNILAQNAEVEGELKGNVEITEILILKPTAIIHGDILTNKLIVESGAAFNGGCKMGVTNKEIKIGGKSQSNGSPVKREGAKAV